MSRTVRVRDTDQPSAATDGGPDWANLYPADPELMVSAEGDTRGLADVQRTARRRIGRRGGR
jgi:hypothetical protein